MLLYPLAQFLHHYIAEFLNCSLEAPPVDGTLEHYFNIILHGGQCLIFVAPQGDQKGCHVVWGAMRLEVLCVTADDDVLPARGFDEVDDVGHANYSSFLLE